MFWTFLSCFLTSLSASLEGDLPSNDSRDDPGLKIHPIDPARIKIWDFPAANLTICAGALSKRMKKGGEPAAEHVERPSLSSGEGSEAHHGVGGRGQDGFWIKSCRLGFYISLYCLNTSVYEE